jgi:hypothetical protein
MCISRKLKPLWSVSELGMKTKTRVFGKRKNDQEVGEM